MICKHLLDKFGKVVHLPPSNGRKEKRAQHGKVSSKFGSLSCAQALAQKTCLPPNQRLVLMGHQVTWIKTSLHERILCQLNKLHSPDLIIYQLPFVTLQICQILEIQTAPSSPFSNPNWTILSDVLIELDIQQCKNLQSCFNSIPNPTFLGSGVLHFCISECFDARFLTCFSTLKNRTLTKMTVFIILWHLHTQEQTSSSMQCQGKGVIQRHVIGP